MKDEFFARKLARPLASVLAEFCVRHVAGARIVVSRVNQSGSPHSWDNSAWHDGADLEPTFIDWEDFFSIGKGRRQFAEPTSISFHLNLQQHAHIQTSIALKIHSASAISNQLSSSSAVGFTHVSKCFAYPYSPRGEESQGKTFGPKSIASISLLSMLSQ